MHRPRAPSSPPLTTTHHHSKEQDMHYSSSSPAPSPARPEGTSATQAGHPGDNDVPTWKLARDIVRGVTEELYGPHSQSHRRAEA